MNADLSFDVSHIERLSTEEDFQCYDNIKIFLELQLSEVFFTDFIANSTQNTNYLH